ncbi:hypothetical protein LOTGIDRAFT_169742 [Lottia gigantea]|uniref:Tonsoku-like protein n=1 Tax=Lottia gigantea TaxID=225164 RepID=V3ZQE2_LOTGI|nr:hypothetical protein LOTGIDRAFT_169742 [Lottia gigantea]ESO83101.1 hypothetical protein LOTGIDRAFT_169742 [Lottia gigantea]
MDAQDSRELQKLLKDRTKAEAKGRFKEVAGLCNCIGELYSKYEQYEDAIVEHKRERTVSENISDDMGVAVACRKLGECYVSLEQFDKALPLLKQYLDLSKSCGEHNDVQRAWTTIGRMFLCQIDSPRSTLTSAQASRKAEDAFIKSLEVCEHLKSSIKVDELMDMKARSFLNLGCVYDIRGETNKSVEYFKRAISLAEKYRLYEVVYLCQVNLSAMYERNGKVSEALRCLDVAINTSQKLKDKFKHSEALLQKAQLQISIGDYEASKHGLKKVKKLGLTRDADYIKMNKLYKAACKMKESIDDLETVDDPKYRIKLYDTLGDCAVDAFNYKQALVYYHKVLELGIDLGLEDKEMVPIYVSLARTYADNKNYVEAIKYYKAELACYKDNREQTGRTWLNIADLEEKLNLGYNKIYNSYLEAFKAVRKTTNRKLQLAVLNSLAETQKYYKQSNHLVITEDKIKTLREKFSNELDEISDEESQPIESNDEEAVVMSELSDSDEEDEGEETVMLTSMTSNSSGTRCSRRSTFKIKKNEKGETPLHRACIENNLKKVKKLIEQGHPVNPRDNSGWIPLHEAANYNYYPIVEYLLDHGAHIDDRGGDMCRGVTPLIDAAENGNFETIELLVNRGANKLAKNDDGNKALDCLLEWKERQEDLDRDTEIQYHDILKLLHNGTACKMKESIDDLETVDDPKYRIKLYDTLGDCAVDAFNYKQALVYYHKVLELGIDLGLEDKEMVPIYVSLARTYADNKNYVEAIKYYKAELACYKDNREQTGRTWLNIADLEEKLNLGYNKIYNSYLEAFKAVRKTTNRKLQLAVLNSLAETQKYYKQSNHLVITEDKIKTLREKFSNELDEISDEESQPIESNDEEAVVMSELSDSDEEDEGEETVMLTSMTSNSSGTRCSRRSTFKIKKNEKGETPLHRACIENNLKKVKKLIEQGHPVNPRDNSGWIPLHEAANYNYYPIVEYLLDHGAHIDDRGGDMCRGVTPLIDAAENGNFETIELLVNRGANKLAKNDDGNKALDCLLEWKERQEDLDRDTEIQYHDILKLLHNGTGSATKLYTKNPKPSAASTTQPIDSFIQYSSDEENLPDPSCMEKSQRLRRLSALKKAPKALIAEDSEPENNPPDSYDSQEIYRSAILDDLNDNVQSATDNYRNAISLVRTSAQNLPSQIPKSAQNRKPSDQTDSNALIGEDNFVGDDWLIDDVGPIKRKFRDCDGFMSGNTTRSASKTKNKRPRIDSDNDETVDLDNLSDVAESDHVSVTPDNHNDVTDDFIQIDDTSPDTLPTLPTRKTQKFLSLKRKPKQTRLTSFGVNSSRRESSQTTFGRSTNFGNLDAWESDSSNSMDAPSSIFGNNSTQSTNFGLSAVSALSSISSAHPTGTQPMGSVMRLKVKVKEKVLLIPVPSSDQNNNINWLCQEISQRYFSLYGLRPLLTLSTIEGAIFSPEDIISMVLVHNDELIGNIDSWDLPPLHQRYRQACKTLSTVVYGNICNILQTSETSGQLELRDLALRSTQLQPIFRALQGTNNLTVLNLQGNCMGDNGVENLSKIFEAMPNLTTLNLACNNISSIGLKYIADSLQKTTDNKALQLLSSLDVKYNILGDSCIPSLASLISSLPSLSILNLSSCLLTSNCFQHHRIILANSLIASNLQELNVSYNKFGTLGVELLLKCLNNQKLRVLKLSHIQQGSSSSQLSLHLQQFISQSGCSLEELDISACNLSTDDLHFITRYRILLVIFISTPTEFSESWIVFGLMKMAGDIKELRIFFTQKKSERLPASCPRIHKLTISKNNRITNQTLQQLLHQTALESSSKLDEIIANGCSVKSPLDTQFLDALSDIVNRESPLRYLSLTCDNLDKVDSDCVKQVWEEKWKNLSKINIQGNLIQLSVSDSNS